MLRDCALELIKDCARTVAAAMVLCMVVGYAIVSEVRNAR